MWLLAPELQPPIFSVVVAIVAFFVRRRVGWGWLLVVMVGFSAVWTGFAFTWSYVSSPLTLWEALSRWWPVAVALFFVLVLLSGLVVWLVALIVPPRTTPKGAPSTGLPEGPEDTHELLGLPRHYEALFLEYLKARQQARGCPWYRAVVRSFVPSYVREDLSASRQALRVPDYFRRDFVAAAPVLTALREMPTTHLSALEAYHRVNLRRARRRLAPIRLIGGALVPVMAAASRVLPSVTTQVATWGAVQASVLAFVAQPGNWNLITILVGVVLGFSAGSLITWWKQRRLERVGELLTMALAHRRWDTVGDTGPWIKMTNLDQIERPAPPRGSNMARTSLLGQTE